MLRPTLDPARPDTNRTAEREVVGTRAVTRRPPVAELSGSASIPLTVILSPARTRVHATVTEALRWIALNLLASDPPLSGGDPRVVADLVVLDTYQLRAPREGPVREARTRWPSALIVCVNVETESLASDLLERGADIALRDDVSPEYLKGVLSAAARRLNHANAELRITFGDLVFDKDARRVWCAGVPVSLTERELQLFQHLFLHAGHVVAYTALAACAWRMDPTITSNGLAVYIGYLRRKLRNSRLTELVTVRGEGYGLRLRAYARDVNATADTAGERRSHESL